MESGLTAYTGQAAYMATAQLGKLNPGDYAHLRPSAGAGDAVVCCMEGSAAIVMVASPPPLTLPAAAPAFTPAPNGCSVMLCDYLRFCGNFLPTKTKARR